MLVLLAGASVPAVDAFHKGQYGYVRSGLVTLVRASCFGYTTCVDDAGRVTHVFFPIDASSRRVDSARRAPVHYAAEL